MFTVHENLQFYSTHSTLYSKGFTCRAKNPLSLQTHVLAITISSKVMVFDCDIDVVQHSKTVSLQNL